MSRSAALGVCLAVLAVCALARPLAAEDWLAAFEPQPANGAPALQLYYPRAELPAVVAAGDVLVARLQLMAALTPPPGVQQARALTGFTAELRGDGLALAAARTHRHRLRVLSLRPDGGSSLVYRVRLRVPAFVAPGTYAFELRTPFGARAALRAVRVISAGSEPRLAACPPPSAAGDSAADAELGSLPVDVWFCAAASARLPDAPGSLGLVAAPELHPSAAGGALALRVGTALWRLGGAAHSAAFERALRSVMGVEQRRLATYGPEAAPSELPTLPALAFTPPHSTRTPRSLVLESPVARRLALLFPAGHALPRASAALVLYPATDLRLHEAGSVLALLEMGAGARTEITFADPVSARGARSALDATRTYAGQPAALRVTGAPEDARVAYEWGDKTALAGLSLRARMEGPLEEPARALVMSRMGGAQLLRTRVQVDASRPPNCSVLRGPRRARPTLFAWALLCSWVMLLKIRRRSGVGNRLRPHVRCELRHGATYTLSPHLDLPSALHRAVRVRADHDSQHARGRHAGES